MMNKISFEKQKSSHNIESEVLSESKFNHASSSHTNYYQEGFGDNKNVEKRFCHIHSSPPLKTS